MAPRDLVFNMARVDQIWRKNILVGLCRRLDNDGSDVDDDSKDGGDIDGGDGNNSVDSEDDHGVVMVVEEWQWW